MSRLALPSKAPAAAARGALSRAALRRVPGALLAGLLAALLLTALAAGAWALTPQEVEERVLSITDGLRCPTCQGISVRDSEAAFSRQIHDKVRRMVEEGQSDEDIRAYFVSRYGEWILRAPKKEGLGLVIWLAPGTLLLVGLGAIGWRLYRNQQRNTAAPAPGGTALTPEQQQRIARDLQRFQEEE